MINSDTPLHDIEGAIREEVEGMNKQRRPYMQALPRTTEDAPLPVPENTDPEPVPVHDVLAALDERLQYLYDRLEQIAVHLEMRLARIDRVLGIK